MSEGTTRAEAAAHILARETGRRMRRIQARIDEVGEQVDARFAGNDLALEGLTSTDEALEARIASVSGAVEELQGDEQRMSGELRVTDAQVAAIAIDVAAIAGRITANDAIDAAQDAELTGLTGRVEGLESRAPVPGPPGPKGDKGPAGPMGRTAYGGGGGSATIQSGGTLVANRPVINFVSGATVADDATNNRVNVTVSGGGGGNINSVSVSSGLSITGTSDLTITNTGVRSLAATGISVSSATGEVTITAPTVSGGTGITVSGSGTTTLTVSATGVNSVSAGTGISVSGTTALTVSATGVNSIAAGTAISVSGTTTMTVTNTGVTSLAGTGVSVSAATGAVTITAPVVAGGTGISVSGSQTTSLSISNTGVTSLVAGSGITVSGATGAVTVTATGSAGATLGPIGVPTTDGMKIGIKSGAGGAMAIQSAGAAVGSRATINFSSGMTVTDSAGSARVDIAPSFGTPGAVTGGATAASGSATTLARSDHVHSTASMPVLLASTTISSATVSYTFSSIPSTYTHLRLIGQGRSTYSGVQVNFGLQFNGDTGSNYWHNNDPSSAKTQIIVAILEGETNFFSTAFGSFDVVITRYQSATYKTARGSFLFNASTTTGNPVEAGYAGFWINTAAITSVTCAFVSGLSMKAGSQLSLYGLP